MILDKQRLHSLKKNKSEREAQFSHVSRYFSAVIQLCCKHSPNPFIRQWVLKLKMKTKNPVKKVILFIFFAICNKHSTHKCKSFL